MSSKDRQFMATAIQLAYKGLYTTDPNPRVGCVLVKDDRVIGSGWHERAGEGHAEVNAIAAAKASGEAIKGATAYVTLEPCSHFGKTPPCAAALVKEAVARVVIGMVDPNPEVSGRGVETLRAAGIVVDGPLLEAECEALNPGFIKRMKYGLPWVRCKMAMSLDGRTAMASGESKWITGADARRDVQKLRLRSSAMLTGIGTVLADDPSLNVRADDLGWTPSRQPRRIVVDTHLAIDPKAKIFHALSSDQNQPLSGSSSSPVTVVTVKPLEESQAYREKRSMLASMGVDILTLASEQNSCVNDKHENSKHKNNTDHSSTQLSVPLEALLKQLASQGVNEVMVESGARLAGSFVEQQLVDELIIYMAPCIMGSQAKGLLDLPDLNAMRDKIGLNIKHWVPVGSDFRITAELDNNKP